MKDIAIFLQTWYDKGEMHKFVIDSCKITCRAAAFGLSTEDKTAVFERAEFFGASDEGLSLTVDGKTYVCPISAVREAKLVRRTKAEPSDRLTFSDGKGELVTVVNDGHKARFRLLSFIFDYVTAVGFLADAKAGVAVRLGEEYDGCTDFPDLLCTRYERKGEETGSNDGKRVTGKGRAEFADGVVLTFGDGKRLELPLDDVSCVIFDKNRRFDAAVVSFCSRKHTGLYFSLRAEGEEIARKLESAVARLLAERFRLDRRANNLFHPKEKNKGKEQNKNAPADGKKGKTDAKKNKRRK